MSEFSNVRDNGYQKTIKKGIDALSEFKTLGLTEGEKSREESIAALKIELNTADAVVVGAGAGLSTSAGFVYNGERFEKYFFDFKERYGITDMYSGGFYPFPDEETRWAWWARHIYFNRYVKAPKPVYNKLLDIVGNKDYFVITTNVDHQFQRAGFDKERLFYTQGDYGLFQSVGGRIKKTYDNEAWVMEAMEAQGFIKDENGEFTVRKDRQLSMRIPRELTPVCPDNGGKVVMNLRSDQTFVEDDGWHKAAARYYDFIENHNGAHVLYLEIGVGANTPVIIKYPFWAMTNENERAFYACLNYDDAVCPRKIEARSVCIGGDVSKVFDELEKIKKV